MSVFDDLLIPAPPYRMARPVPTLATTGEGEVYDKQLLRFEERGKEERIRRERMAKLEQRAAKVAGDAVQIGQQMRATKDTNLSISGQEFEKIVIQKAAELGIVVPGSEVVSVPADNQESTISVAPVNPEPNYPEHDFALEDVPGYKMTTNPPKPGETYGSTVEEKLLRQSAAPSESAQPPAPAAPPAEKPVQSQTQAKKEDGDFYESFEKPVQKEVPRLDTVEKVEQFIEYSLKAGKSPEFIQGLEKLRESMAKEQSVATPDTQNSIGKDGEFGDNDADNVTLRNNTPVPPISVPNAAPTPKVSTNPNPTPVTDPDALVPPTPGPFYTPSAPPAPVAAPAAPVVSPAPPVTAPVLPARASAAPPNIPGMTSPWTPPSPTAPAAPAAPVTPPNIPGMTSPWVTPTPAGGPAAPVPPAGPASAPAAPGRAPRVPSGPPGSMIRSAAEWASRKTGFGAWSQVLWPRLKSVYHRQFAENRARQQEKVHGSLERANEKQDEFEEKVENSSWPFKKFYAWRQRVWAKAVTKREGQVDKYEAFRQRRIERHNQLQQKVFDRYDRELAPYRARHDSLAIEKRTATGVIGNLETLHATALKNLEIAESQRKGVFGRRGKVAADRIRKNVKNLAESIKQRRKDLDRIQKPLAQANARIAIYEGRQRGITEVMKFPEMKNLSPSTRRRTPAAAPGAPAAPAAVAANPWEMPPGTPGWETVVPLRASEEWTAAEFFPKWNNVTAPSLHIDNQADFETFVTSQRATAGETGPVYLGRMLGLVKAYVRSKGGSISGFSGDRKLFVDNVPK